jgi:hypothetical protein
MVIVQISRGVGPGWAIVDAMRYAEEYDNPYFYVDGMSCPDAKNRAVEIADKFEDDLLLIEDDIRASQQTWHAIQTYSSPDAIVTATTNKRTGKSNLTRAPNGKFLATGTVFVKIPRTVYTRLEAPVFRPWTFARTADGDEIIDRGPCKSGHGSDWYFWYTARQLKPEPEIIVIGTVAHLKHPLNTGTSDHDNPYEEEHY